MLDIHEQSEQKLEKQSLPKIFKWDFYILHASDEDIENIIEDQDSKLFHIHIKVQPDEYWVKPCDYIESIDTEYKQKFKSERIKKRIWWKKISENERKKLGEKWEEWRVYFAENRERREDWETKMMYKYQELWEQKKESEIKKMKWTRYREIEKYKEYPAVYNTLLQIRDHSNNIENIDLLIMENSKKYEMEERNKDIRDLISEILSKESNIEEIRQDRNKTMESTKANILYTLSQIQEKWDTLINELWKNKDNAEEIVQMVQIFERIIDSIPQNISSNVKKEMDRIKYIYRREWWSWYKYYNTINFLKEAWKQIIEC